MDKLPPPSTAAAIWSAVAATVEVANALYARMLARRSVGAAVVAPEASWRYMTTLPQDSRVDEPYSRG